MYPFPSRAKRVFCMTTSDALQAQLQQVEFAMDTQGVSPVNLTDDAVKPAQELVCTTLQGLLNEIRNTFNEGTCLGLSYILHNRYARGLHILEIGERLGLSLGTERKVLEHLSRQTREKYERIDSIN